MAPVGSTSPWALNPQDAKPSASPEQRERESLPSLCVTFWERISELIALATKLFSLHEMDILLIKISIAALSQGQDMSSWDMEKDIFK